MSEMDPKQRENAPLTTLPRAFILQRDIDQTGVSGVGVVAWGVEFPDGVCALRWTSQWPTSVVFHELGMDSVKAVHGHDGMTRVIFMDEEFEKVKELHEAAFAVLGDIEDDHRRNALAKALTAFSPETSPLTGAEQIKARLASGAGKRLGQVHKEQER